MLHPGSNVSLSFSKEPPKLLDNRFSQNPEGERWVRPSPTGQGPRHLPPSPGGPSWPGTRNRSPASKLTALVWAQHLQKLPPKGGCSLSRALAALTPMGDSLSGSIHWLTDQLLGQEPAL